MQSDANVFYDVPPISECEAPLLHPTHPRMKKEDRSGSDVLLSALGLGLSIAGLPELALAVGGTKLIKHLAQGEHGKAAVDGIGMIPGIGKVAGVGKK
jgi:hypothetical protein